MRRFLFLASVCCLLVAAPVGCAVDDLAGPDVAASGTTGNEGGKSKASGTTGNEGGNSKASGTTGNEGGNSKASGTTGNEGGN